MSNLKDIITNGSVAIFVAGLSAWLALYQWDKNKEAEFERNQFVRKEERYRGLIKSLKGFSVTGRNSEQIDLFIENYQLLWLYAPDTVIQLTNSFLKTVHTGNEATSPGREKAMRCLILEMRQDMLVRKRVTQTSLSDTEFQFIQSHNDNPTSPQINK